jgi:hypothetical protein
MRRAVIFLTCTLAGGATAARERPAPEDPSAEPMTIDLDTAFSRVLARMPWTPRFEEEVEVRDRYQEALDAHLRAAELKCGATSSGPPGPDEMNRHSANPKPPSADLLAAGELTFRKLKGFLTRKQPRFFLSAVHREDAPERVVYVVRDGPISENARSSIPGTAWELVARFVDREEAANALRRREAGRAATEGSQDGPRTLWAATSCSH